MGNEAAGGYNAKNKYRKNDKLAFAETPGMYEHNVVDNGKRNNNVKKSIVLQRRYRDDSIAEESVSVVSVPQKKVDDVVRKEDKERSTVKTEDVVVVPVNDDDNKKKEEDVVLPKISNNNRRIRNIPVIPVISNIPSVNKKKELSELETPVVSVRQRRYRPYNPVINSFPTKPRVRIANNKTQNVDSDESVEYYNNYSSNNNNPLTLSPSRYNNNNNNNNNMRIIFNRTQLFPPINNNNTCRQCGLITSKSTKCCCTCSCACSCNKHKCINHCNCYSLHTSHNTTPPKPFREQSYLLRQYPKSSYHPIQEPLLQANSFFNYHYAPTPSINISTNDQQQQHLIIPLSNTSLHKAIPYTNAYHLHYDSITYIISLTPPISQTYYATSSIDNTIKLWDDTINLISTIQTHKTHSKCLLHFQTEYLLSAESINILAYTIRLPNTVQYIFRDHIDDVNYLLSIGDRFISVGNDKTLRLWNINPERVGKYYDGHNSAVKKVAKVFNGVYLASFGDDNKILVWELTQSFPLTCIDTGYTVADVHGTGFGFVSGSYDNKVRCYSLKSGNAELFAVFEMGYYHCRSFISGNEQDDVFLFNTFVNEIVALDTNMKRIVKLFKGPPYDKRINMVIKDSYWENRCSDDNGKRFIGVCQDGCLYIWNYTGNNETINNGTTKGNESRLKLPALDMSYGNYRRYHSEKELNVLNTNNIE